MLFSPIKCQAALIISTSISSLLLLISTGVAREKANSDKIHDISLGGNARWPGRHIRPGISR